MDVSLILKVLGIGLIVTAASQMLAKSGREEQGVYVTIAGILVTLFLLIEEIAELFRLIGDVFGL